LGIITTIACHTNIFPGYSGDGGAATAAECIYPVGVTVSYIGEIFFTDEDDNRIRKIDTSGIISTVAGNGIAGYSGDGGPSALANLNSPAAITTDNSLNIYVADLNNNRIRKIDGSRTKDGSSAKVKTINPTLFLIDVYPNPATTKLTLTASARITTVAISNLLGQTVYSHEYNADKVQIDVADLPAGIYFIRINGTEVRRFVKE
jgi:hypothetical protein